MIIDPTTSAVIAGVSVSVISGILLGWLNRRWKKQDKHEAQDGEMEETLKQVQKNIWRLNKTVLIMAKMIDDQTEKQHPELSSSLEDIAKELLNPDKS